MLIRDAEPEDWPAVEALLSSCALPVVGAREHFTHFIVCEDDGGIVGCAGAEIYGKAALLRSVAVHQGARGKGVGDKLTTTAIARVRSRNVAIVALLTTTAESYFALRGFNTVERRSLPDALADSSELNGACPETAVAMLLRL